MDDERRAGGRIFTLRLTVALRAQLEFVREEMGRQGDIEGVSPLKESGRPVFLESGKEANRPLKRKKSFF